MDASHILSMLEIKTIVLLTKPTFSFKFLYSANSIFTLLSKLEIL